MKLRENHIQVFLCGRVLSAHKNSTSKFISPGKLDFSKSKILKSAHKENFGSCATAGTAAALQADICITEISENAGFSFSAPHSEGVECPEKK